MTVTECASVSLEPVAVTEYTPAPPMQDRADVPDPVTLVGVRVQVRPVEGLMLAVRPTTPLNPFRAVIEMVVVPETPAFSVTPPVGLAAMAKSWTV